MLANGWVNVKMLTLNVHVRVIGLISMLWLVIGTSQIIDVFVGSDDVVKIRDWAVEASPSYKSKLGKYELGTYIY